VEKAATSFFREKFLNRHSRSAPFGPVSKLKERVLSEGDTIFFFRSRERGFLRSACEREKRSPMWSSTPILLSKICSSTVSPFIFMPTVFFLSPFPGQARLSSTFPYSPRVSSRPFFEVLLLGRQILFRRIAPSSSGHPFSSGLFSP